MKSVSFQLPSSSMIVYLLPTVLPFCSLFSGVIRIFVTDISSADFKGVAHSLQNFAVSEFSD
jgi:hypothetical protein